MSNEESELFQGGKKAPAKPSFGDDGAPDRTARETAAAMQAMDVESLIGATPQSAAQASGTKSLSNLFGAPASGAAAAARPRKAATPAATTAAPAPAPAACPAPGPRKRGIFARLFGWLLSR